MLFLPSFRIISGDVAPYYYVHNLDFITETISFPILGVADYF